MQKDRTDSRLAPLKEQRVQLALAIALMLIILICLASGVLLQSVMRLSYSEPATPTPSPTVWPTSTAWQFVPRLRTPPPFPTIKIHPPSSQLNCRGVSVCNPMFNGQNMICIYTVQMVCDSVTITPATITATPIVTPTATVTSTPTATITPSPTATFTPTPTATPMPFVSPVMLAGASMFVVLVCLMLLIGVFVWGFRRGSP